MLALFAFTFSSCKEYVEEVKETIVSAEDNAIAENEFAALYELVDDFVSLDMQATHILPQEAVVLLYDTSFTDGDGKAFSIYFGDLDSVYPLGVLCNDGRYRAGFIKVKVTNPFKTIGSIIEIEANHDECFFSGNGEDMYKIEGKITAIRSNLNKVDIEINDAVLKTDDFEIEWESERQLTVTHDAGLGMWGDVYEMTGVASGKNRLGEDFEAVISKPLVKYMGFSCATTFVEGLVDIDVPSHSKKIIVDYDPYSDQKCDKVAQAEINGKRTIFKVK